MSVLASLQSQEISACDWVVLAREHPDLSARLLLSHDVQVLVAVDGQVGALDCGGAMYYLIVCAFADREEIDSAIAHSQGVLSARLCVEET